MTPYLLGALVVLSIGQFYRSLEILGGLCDHFRLNICSDWLTGWGFDGVDGVGDGLACHVLVFSWCVGVRKPERALTKLQNLSEVSKSH